MLMNTHRPRRSLGQNFLIDENIAHKIVTSLSLTNQDKVLEIGAGPGILTKHIIPQVNKCIAVEIDRDLSAELNLAFSDFDSFELIQDDFLNVQLKNLLSKASWKVVGNIPYHLTSSIIFRIFEIRESVQSLTLMVQREVAERIQAKPGTKRYGILAVMSQLYADVNILFYISRNVFYPKPKVDSAIVQWKFLQQPRFQIKDERAFLAMIKAIFGQRRKILKNSLKSFGVDVENLDFPLNKRPEQLTVAELTHLNNLIA